VLAIAAAKAVHVVQGGVQFVQGVEGVACLTSDCILEQPGLNNALETTCLTSSGAEIGEFMVYARGSVIRNCFVNCEYRDNPVPVLSIVSAGGGVFTVTTSLPHGHVTGDWVVISGALVNGSPYNPNSFNGSYVISSATDTTFQYTPSPAQPASPLPSGNIWVGKFPSQFVQITGITVVQYPPGPPPPPPPAVTWIVTVTTATPHFLVPGRNVLMNGVAPTSPTSLNASFQVLSVSDPYNFTFQVLNQSSAPAGSYTGQFIGPSFQGGGVDGGTAAVWEGNRILNVIPATYNDTNNSRDQIIRNNYFRRVALGSRKLLGRTQVSTTPTVYPLASLSNGGSGSIATATTQQPHGFAALVDLVIISGATGPYKDLYNGTFQVLSVPNATTFTYAMTASPGAAAPGVPPASYATGGNVSGGLAPDKQQRLLGLASPSTPALTYALTNGLYIATATVDLNIFRNGHGLRIGETVYISKANFTGSSRYSGYFGVTGVSSEVPYPKSFYFILPENPNPPNASGSSPSGYYGRLWTGGRVVEENNLMDLAPSQTENGSTTGVSLGDGVGPSPVLFPQVLLRRNIMRQVDGISDPPYTPANYVSQGISVQACGALTVEENAMDLPAAHNVQQRYCGSTQYFANQTSAGALIPGYNLDTSSNTDELSTNIDDAAVLAF
jgi:hypothetical protein